MNQAVSTNSASAAVLKQKMNSRFRAQGVLYGLISGITFGLYGVVASVAMSKDPLIGVAGAFAVPFVCSAINDLVAAGWLFIWNAMKGRIKEIGRSLRTFPGLMVIVGALFGGPVANGAYLVGIEAAGAYAIPISALFPMFGAIFARIFLKQKIEKRVAIGMAICVVGAIVISYVRPEGVSENFTLGIICAFIAAVGWGLEGVFSAFGMSMIDSNIAINIRQATSGLVFIFIVLPVIGSTGLFFKTMATMPVMAIISFAALLSAVTFLTWYMANSMVGVAVGMSLNSTYVMWGILFAAIFLGDTLTPTIIVGSVIITVGAILVSVNPMDFLKKKEA